MDKPVNDTPSSHDMICIDEITQDHEAEIIASLFESHQIRCVIQGRHNRRMLGVVGGQLIRMRLLVAAKDEQQAKELLQHYKDNLADHSVEDEEIEGLRFNRRAQKMGLSLLLGAIVGFGTASFVAGLKIWAILLGLLQCATYFIDASWCADWFAEPKKTILIIRTCLPVVDVVTAWIYLMSKPASYFHVQSKQDASHSS